MKVFVVIAVALVAVVAAHDILTDHNDAFHELMHEEAEAIIAANPGISIHDCTMKCDALFNFLVAANEKLSDDLCAHVCKCEITPGDCEHAMATKNPPVTMV